ncbi:hypothetical protein FACS1894201_09830 [Bacteroidia bacterium]|nr:hypothetical protein FACS1894201_09830 [Bacteroidia bacterium]
MFWHFDLFLQFQPSSVNFVRIYLISDTLNLSGALNGYFIQLGQSGGKNNLRFFKQTGLQTELLFTGTSVFSEQSGISLTIQALRRDGGYWEFLSRAIGSSEFVSEGQGFRDNTYTSSKAFGFYCKYQTASRYNLYGFDNVCIDTLPSVDPRHPTISVPTLHAGDLCISEIMQDPLTDMPEYIELFNNADHAIAMSECHLATYDLSKNTFKLFQITKSSDMLLLPKHYVVISRSITNLLSGYDYCDDALFITLSTMPTLPNSAGSVIISTADTTIIDWFNYTDKMHFPLLLTTKGVALERIHYDKSANDNDNWRSASKSVNFASIGCPNSQRSQLVDNNDPFTLSEACFSPNNDGINDVLHIQYNLPSGFVGHIRIFNEHGQLIRYLVNNQILSSSGYYFWDGLSEQKSLCPYGTYIVVFDLYNLDGQTCRYKKTTCIAPF